MLIAPLPVNELARLQTLASLDVLDTPSDDVLDGLVRTAASVIGCPVSVVTLVDQRRQYFKARHGIEVSETPRDVAFCAHAILQDDIFEVPDCHRDERFADNPLVTGPARIRFYAGVPIVVDGQTIGTFCVIDHVPRNLTPAQRTILQDLAHVVEHWFESWRQKKVLAASVALGNTLFENLEDGVMLIDAAFQIRDANAHTLALLGYQRSELIGKPLKSLLADNGWTALKKDLLSPKTRQTGSRRESVMVRRNGARFDAEIYVRAGTDRGYLAVVRDVTERRAHERLLRQQSLAIEQSFAGIMICDLQGKFVYANKAALQMSGYSGPELIGSDQRMLESPSVPAETYEAIRAILRSGRPYSGMLYSRRKDGTEYTQLATISPLVMEDGGVTHNLIVTEDMTEKQRMSKELEKHRNHLEDLVLQRTAELALAKRAAESASRAKSDFLALMSHEIRTPMNGVLGIVEVLRASLDPQQLELADTIRDSALALLGIIDEVLDFSKVEAGHLQIKREPVELLRVAESVCDALLPVATSRGVVLHVFVSPDLPATVVSDDLRLRQMLNNLLGNAIKFSGDRPVLGRVWLRIEAGDTDHFRIVVGDNGIGMAREVQKLVFEPFVQAEGSTTRRFGGTGLGLTICRRLVALFGGKIRLRSAPDKGSVFTLTLPLEAVDDLPAAPARGVLDGVHVHLVPRSVKRARDWAAYLEAAGATTEVWRRCPSPQRIRDFDRPGRAVLLIDGDDRARADLRAAAVVDGIPLIELQQGTRRGVRVIEPSVVSLESGAVRRSTLVDAAAFATGRKTPDVASGTTPVRVKRMGRSEAIAQGRLILVVEDSELNRKVMEQQLALLGHPADMVVNGVEALERWRDGEYGLILTDLHMPSMDGYTLTARIRSEEAARASSSPGTPARTPILALTANALRGERERCLAIGMDDYLTKPLQLDPLSNALARWLPRPSPTGAAESSSPADGFIGDGEPDQPAYDPSMLPKLIGDDPKVLAEVRAEFVASATATAKDLRLAVANGECATIGSLAHRLKASARAIGATALGRCCERFEEASLSGPCTAVRSLLDEFEAVFAALLTAMSHEERAPEAPSRVPPAAEVMVVDDDPFELGLIQRQLEFSAAPVLTYDSATAALAALENRDTSALLLLFDLNMPGMDGVELMRHLAERDYAGSIALISGADSRVLETASKLAVAYQLNVLSYLHKPVRKEALRDLLDRWRTFIPAHAQREDKTYGAAEIRQGIDRDQMVVQYQPKVSLKDGSLVGVEALIRWHHPVDGILYPDRFIAVAENHGLVDDLTYVVLEKAVAQARVWRERGLALRVAVNVSMVNLKQLDFPERVLDIVERHRMQPSDLILEVTESTLMLDTRAPLNSLTRLRLRAVGLSIDDFGTGHSSLTQLRDIPFDELKIDRSFIHGVGEQPTQKAIFLASLKMAHELNMKVVAEGVEDLADWSFVRDAGCDVAQGYFIGRPMDGGALVAWAREWQARYAGGSDVSPA